MVSSKSDVDLRAEWHGQSQRYHVNSRGTVERASTTRQDGRNRVIVRHCDLFDKDRILQVLVLGGNLMNRRQLLRHSAALGAIAFSGEGGR